MTLWFVFAVMTAAAIFAVLLPLGLGARNASDGREAAVYKDQLAEIERDVETGLIGKVEAEAARVEIGRRLLAAADQENEPSAKPSVGLRRVAAVLALIGVPIVALAVYLPLGSPQLPDFPLTARAKPADGSQPLENLVSQVEQHLQKNPTDGRGWTVLAPVLARLGRTEDAIRAYRNMINYAGDGAAKRADLGEVMTAAAGGVVTAEAKAEFERGHALDADEPKANYYLGLAAEQDGRKDDAATIWRAMLSKGPADAPWRPLVVAALARVGGGEAPALPNEAMAAAKDMSADDRDAMIRGMVDRLATRLKQNGDDVEGWLRLVRAYVVMGDLDKAKSALSDARQAVKDAERLRQLNEGVKTFGLDG
ncbi:Cytochrome c-type biogenesis protein cycH [Bradyrhizobium sp. ORS 285]|uniref:c-type cytochrome biogenesis protein CcmI n=1 Tax=Bradyrhizobium sp. ORS 285 TaxID=115808 RepID=UPI0002408FE8|nr:c-type cytochrome biogenesis protein CcmI [Bradyrhizobium sp. ORS 285]CCD89202.1 Cytochrome c-type biogenesis protein cycH [Bradyrhizobium sp. ORS 285]SMX59459.1 Cytochrome c-type biogenesis protein cycH [Bradyrhizobium sp. ORS 285]